MTTRSAKIIVNALGKSLRSSNSAGTLDPLTRIVDGSKAGLSIAHPVSTAYFCRALSTPPMSPSMTLLSSRLLSNHYMNTYNRYLYTNRAGCGVLTGPMIVGRSFHSSIPNAAAAAAADKPGHTGPAIRESMIDASPTYLPDPDIGASGNVHLGVNVLDAQALRMGAISASTMSADEDGNPIDDDPLTLEDIAEMSKTWTVDDLRSLGNAYFHGQGVKKDYLRAVHLWKGASDRGDLPSLYMYACCVRVGLAVEKNSREAAKMFSRLAKVGHPYAQLALGNMFFAGEGTTQNFVAARELYEISSKNGVIAAYFNLGHIYESGKGVESGPDPAKALEMFRMGASRGDVYCKFVLGNRYCRGEGVAVSLDTGFKYLTEAAASGFAPALFNVGVMYLSGKFVARDDSKAAECFKLAAEKGFPFAQTNLAQMYMEGRGVNKDVDRARQLLEAASKVDPNAQSLLQILNEQHEAM